jgi:Fe-Mn family superoxide dismutase
MNSTLNRRDALKLSGAAAAMLATSNWTAAAQQAPAAAPATSQFILPALPYKYEALEPYFDAETMHLHHDKHHQAYVTNLNKAVGDHPELAGKTIEELLTGLDAMPEALRTTIRNQGGGHYNHSFWWPRLGTGSPAPIGELAKAISAKFGTHSAFEEQLTKAAMGVFGSGWAWLVKGKDGALAITTTANQDSPISAGLKPILAVDVWEHAYYLKYHNVRADYVKAFFSVVKWDVVSAGYAGLA